MEKYKNKNTTKEYNNLRVERSGQTSKETHQVFG